MSLTDPIVQFAPFILIIGIFYLLVIRPQQQRMKQMRAMLDNVKRGDTVVTAGGIIGRVTKAPQKEDVEITVEISDNVQVRVLKSTLTEVRPKNAPADAKSDKS
jgi:preprotein translocase subunit YajC